MHRVLGVVHINFVNRDSLGEEPKVRNFIYKQKKVGN